MDMQSFAADEENGMKVKATINLYKTTAQTKNTYSSVKVRI